VPKFSIFWGFLKGMERWNLLIALQHGAWCFDFISKLHAICSMLHAIRRCAIKKAGRTSGFNHIIMEKLK